MQRTVSSLRGRCVKDSGKRARGEHGAAGLCVLRVQMWACALWTDLLEKSTLVQVDKSCNDQLEENKL